MAVRVALVGWPPAAVEPALGDAVVVRRHEGGPLRCDVALVGGDASGALEAVRAFASAGGAVMGVGDGFAVLCRGALLPGAVEPGAPPGPALSHVRVEGRATPFTWAIPAGRVLPVEAAAFAARYVGPAVETAGHVILRYCDAAGGVESDAVAGICDPATRIIGLLPPLGGALGRQFFSSVRLGVGRKEGTAKAPKTPNQI